LSHTTSPPIQKILKISLNLFFSSVRRNTQRMANRKKKKEKYHC
jgi:hypothetical protein